MLKFKKFSKRLEHGTFKLPFNVYHIEKLDCFGSVGTNCSGRCDDGFSGSGCMSRSN